MRASLAVLGTTFLVLAQGCGSSENQSPLAGDSGSSDGSDSGSSDGSDSGKITPQKDAAIPETGPADATEPPDAPATCPMTAPNDGDPCSHVGEFCEWSYPHMICPIDCTCIEPDTGSAGSTWSCGTPDLC